MAYQPYQDIDSLLGSVKRSSEGVTAKQVEDILKSNQVFYKSSYSGVSDRIGAVSYTHLIGKDQNFFIIGSAHRVYQRTARVIDIELNDTARMVGV